MNEILPLVELNHNAISCDFMLQIQKIFLSDIYCGFFRKKRFVVCFFEVLKLENELLVTKMINK